MLQTESQYSLDALIYSEVVKTFRGLWRIRPDVNECAGHNTPPIPGVSAAVCLAGRTASILLEPPYELTAKKPPSAAENGPLAQVRQQLL